MDISIDKYLESTGEAGRELRVVAALATTHPQVRPFLITPFLGMCHQGAQHHAVIVLAERGEVVLYADSDTHQFGIAFQSAARRDHVFAGREYPSIDLAVCMFLGELAALDCD
jgi:hypothetical protein